MPYRPTKWSGKGEATHDLSAILDISRGAGDTGPPHWAADKVLCHNRGVWSGVGLTPSKDLDPSPGSWSIGVDMPLGSIPINAQFKTTGTRERELLLISCVYNATNLRNPFY